MNHSLVNEPRGDIRENDSEGFLITCSVHQCKNLPKTVRVFGTGPIAFEF